MGTLDLVWNYFGMKHLGTSVRTGETPTTQENTSYCTLVIPGPYNAAFKPGGPSYQSYPGFCSHDLTPTLSRFALESKFTS